MATKSFIDRMVTYYQMLSDGDPIFMRFGDAQLIGFLLGKNSVDNDSVVVKTKWGFKQISISDIREVQDTILNYEDGGA